MILIMAEYASFELPVLPEFDRVAVPGSVAFVRRTFPEIRALRIHRHPHSAERPVVTVSLREACITMMFRPTERFDGDGAVDVQCRIEPGVDPKGHVADFLDRFEDYLRTADRSQAPVVALVG
jgi:hypothetical protein